MKLISNWLETHTRKVREDTLGRYNIIMARDFQTMLCGVSNRMPWYVVEDLIFFRKMTIGCVVVMGRNTMESLNCKPLPGRVNIVVSRTLRHPPEGFVLFRSVQDVISQVSGTIFFIGGPSLLRSVVDELDAYSLFLSELDLPDMAKLNGQKVFLSDEDIFGKYKQIDMTFDSGWLMSEFSNTQVRFQGFHLCKSRQQV